MIGLYLAIPVASFCNYKELSSFSCSLMPFSRFCSSLIWIKSRFLYNQSWVNYAVSFFVVTLPVIVPKKYFLVNRTSVWVLLLYVHHINKGFAYRLIGFYLAFPLIAFCNYNEHSSILCSLMPVSWLFYFLLDHVMQ